MEGILRDRNIQWLAIGNHAGTRGRKVARFRHHEDDPATIKVFGSGHPSTDITVTRQFRSIYRAIRSLNQRIRHVIIVVIVLAVLMVLIH